MIGVTSGSGNRRNGRMAKGFNQIRSPKERPDEMVYQMLTGVALLISALSTASAQTWSYGDYGPRAKGCYETPYDGGPQDGQRAVATNTAMAPAIATPVMHPSSTTAPTLPRID